MMPMNQWSLQVVALRDDGTAAGPPLQSVPLTGRPLALKLNGAGDEIFVGGPGLRSFVIDPATGMLAPSGRPLPAVNAGCIAVDLAGRFAYVPALPFGPLTMIDLADPSQTGRSATMLDQLHSNWSMEWMEISTGTAPTRTLSKVLLVTDLTRNTLSSFAIDQN